MNSGFPTWRRRFFVAVGARVFFSLWFAIDTTPQTKDFPSQSPLGQISGHVYRSDTGEPIPKAQVELSAADQDTAKAAGAERIVRTGADGAFLFPDLPAGSYQLEVWRNGFAEFSWEQAEQESEKLRSERTVSLKAGQKLENLLLRLHPAGVISGQVSDEDQDALPGLEVYALSVDYLPGGRKQVRPMGRAVTDDLGNFRIANLPPGAYYVRAGGLVGREMEAVGVKEGPGGGVQYRNTFYPGTRFLDEAQVLQVSPLGGANDLRFTVPTEKTYTIRGKIVAGASQAMKPVEQIECKERSREGYTFETGQETAQIGPNGSFQISRLPPGEYTLSAEAVNQGVQTDLGFASVRIVDSDVRASLEIDRAVEVRGKAEGPQGLSLAGKQITLETFGPGFYFLYQAAVDSSGRFVIKNIPPGDFIFTVSDRDGEKSAYIKKAICNGRDYASSVFTLVLDTTLDCAVTLANDTSVVHGKVMNGEKLAAGMVVALIPESRELRRIPRDTLVSKTDAAGEYTISGVIPGDYLVFAVPPSRDHAYFALDFADDHRRGNGERISLNPSTNQVLNLKVSDPE